MPKPKGFQPDTKNDTLAPPIPKYKCKCKLEFHNTGEFMAHIQMYADKGDKNHGATS